MSDEALSQKASRQKRRRADGGWLGRDHPLERWIDTLKKDLPEHVQKINDWEKQLRAELGGDRIYVPRAPKRVKREQVQNLLLAQVHISAIRESLGISERYLRSLLNERINRG